MESRRDTTSSVRRDPATAPRAASSATARPDEIFRPADASEEPGQVDSSRRSFCDYLIAARQGRDTSLDEIAGVTRIPARSLEYLESGQFEKLPADVFVRGFLRSYARCVGLDVDETIRRYTRCGMTPAPVASPLADELASSMAKLEDHAYTGAVRRVTTVPATSRAMAASRPEGGSSEGRDDEGAGKGESLAAVSETSQVTVEVSAKKTSGDRDAGGGKRRKRRRKRKQRLAGVAKASQTGRPATVVDDTGEPHHASDSSGAVGAVPAVRPSEHGAAEIGGEESAAAEPATIPMHGAEAPSEEPATAEPREGAEAAVAGEIAAGGEAPVVVTVASGPGQRGARRASRARKPQAHRPVLVIDDDRPEEAERIQDERAERADASWRSFLPPSLLDNDEGSHRGALTLAVIILVIVATLTMSYLLRRPSGSGDGITYEQVEIGAPTARA